VKAANPRHPFVIRLKHQQHHLIIVHLWPNREKSVMAPKAPLGKAVPEAIENHIEGVEPSSAPLHDTNADGAPSTEAERSKTEENPKVPGKSVPEAIHGAGKRS
jgi:hypothetical protein